MKPDPQMAIYAEGTSSLSTDGSSGSSSPVFSGTRGDAKMSEDNFTKSNTEVCQDKDLLFSVRISL
jgi:hypothetical protein